MPEGRGAVVFRRCEAGGALLQGRKLDHDETAEFGGALHDLETSAARQHLAAELGDDGGYQVGIFLVLDRIVDFRTRNPISRHVLAPGPVSYTHLTLPTNREVY